MQEILLLLADGRWPSGGYAHSGGLEAVVRSGGVHDLATLESFCAGRLATSGAVDAWFAAAARLDPDVAALARLDDECEARLPAPGLRTAGRRLARGLLRSAAVVWPELDGCTARQHPVALGVVARVAGLAPVEAARLALHGVLMAPLGAAPKLLAIDTADTMAVAMRLAPLADALAADAVATLGTGDAPYLSAPLVELGSLDHVTWEVRLFAS